MSYKNRKKAGRPSPTALLNPRLDPIFKIIFTDNSREARVALTEFLSAIFMTQVSHVKLLPNILSGETKEDKVPQFDLTCKIGSSTYANIEMQGHSHYGNFDNRAEYHVAHLLNHFVNKGFVWKDIPMAFQISVLDFVYDKSNPEGMNHYYMQTKDGKTLANRLNVVFMELPKFKKYVNMDVKEMTPIQRWGLFFLYADNEDYEALMNQLAEEEAGIRMILNLLARISRNDRAWIRQNHFWDSISDYRSMKEYARTTGREEGLAEGREEGLAEGREEGLAEGREVGLAEGRNEKALEDALLLIKKYNATPEQAANDLGVSLELINEVLSKN